MSVAASYGTANGHFWDAVGASEFPIPMPAPEVGTTLLLALGVLCTDPLTFTNDVRLAPPPGQGWVLLGSTRRLTRTPSAPDTDYFYSQLWYRVVPAGAQPTDYVFTVRSYPIGNLPDTPPNDGPIGPYSAVVVLIRYRDIDAADPIHNVSFTASPAYASDTEADPRVTSATTFPPAIAIEDARLVRLTVVDVATNFVSDPFVTDPSMVSPWDIQHPTAPADRVFSLTLADMIIPVGIPSTKATSWALEAFWADYYVALRPKGNSTPDLAGTWQVVADPALQQAQNVTCVASRFDNFLYVLSQETAGNYWHKIHRTTGAVVQMVQIDADHHTFELLSGLGLALDVNATALYVQDRAHAYRKYALDFALQATSTEADRGRAFDVVCGAGASAGLLWALTEETVMRHSLASLAFVDQVDPVLWNPEPAGPHYAALQGALDKDGHLWVLGHDGESASSRLSFVHATTLAVTHYDITSTFPGTAYTLTYYKSENSLYLANSWLVPDVNARALVRKWEIATHTFTATFQSEKKLGFLKAGFKFGPSQCCLPLAFPVAGPAAAYDLPPQRDVSEILLLHTDDLSLVAHFPTNAPATDAFEITGAIDVIFDAAQHPDFLWTQCFVERGGTTPLGWLHTQATILGANCPDPIVPPPAGGGGGGGGGGIPPTVEWPPVYVMNCLPRGVELKATHTKSVLFPKHRSLSS